MKVLFSKKKRKLSINNFIIIIALDILFIYLFIRYLWELRLI